MRNSVLILQEIKIDRLTLEGLIRISAALQEMDCESVVTYKIDCAVRLLQERQFDLVITTMTVDQGRESVFDFLNIAKENDLCLPPVMAITINSAGMRVLSAACAFSHVDYLNLSDYGEPQGLKNAIQNAFAQRAPSKSEP